MFYPWTWTIWKIFFNRSHHGVPSSLRSKSHEYHKIVRKELMAWASPSNGIFRLADKIQRPLPSVPDDPVTHESIHSSVLHQSSVSPVLSGILDLHPKIVSPLLPFEEEMKAKWAYDPSSPSTLAYEKKLLVKDQPKISNSMTVTVSAVRAVQADKPDPTLLMSFFPCFVDRSQ
jgi:hypothetical protein